MLPNKPSFIEREHYKRSKAMELGKSAKEIASKFELIDKLLN